MQQPPLKTGWTKAGTPPHSNPSSGLWLAVAESENTTDQVFTSNRYIIKGAMLTNVYAH